MHYDINLSVLVLNANSVREAACQQAIQEGQSLTEAEKYLSDDTPLEDCLYMAVVRVPDGISLEESSVNLEATGGRK